LFGLDLDDHRNDHGALFGFDEEELAEFVAELVFEIGAVGSGF
jgi:hypothetical protein